jgi:hypothetical protein
MKRTPCAECPWRRDVPTGTWPAERFQKLARTCRDDGWACMACHKSREGEELPCAGFVIVQRMDSIGVRLAVWRGMKLEDYATDVELFGSFEEMLAANDVELPRRNRWTED